MRDYNPTCFTDSSALPVWRVSRRLLVHAHQPLVALAQVVPLSSTGFPLHPGTDGAAAADARRHATFALELERPPGGAVYPLAGWAVESLQPLSCRRGCFLWPRGPQHDADKEEHPHPSPAIKMWWGHMLFFLYLYMHAGPWNNTQFMSHYLHPQRAANGRGLEGFHWVGSVCG